MPIPPKIVKYAARSHFGLAGPGTTSVSLRENFGIVETPESLPVLQAFHDFIESERRAARGKLITLSLFFMAVVIAILAGATVIGITFFRQIQGDMEIVQGESEDARRQLIAVRQQTETAVTSLGRRTDMLRNDLLQGRDAMSSAYAQTAAIAGRLDEISEVLKMLELENSSLKTNIASMDERLPRFSAAWTAESTQGESRAPRGEPCTIAASLALPESETGTIWRFPIPE